MWQGPPPFSSNSNLTICLKSCNKNYDEINKDERRHHPHHGMQQCVENYKQCLIVFAMLRVITQETPTKPRSLINKYIK